MFQSTSSFSGKSESLNSINYYTELEQISKLLQKFESTKLIKSFDVGKPFTFESIDDSHIDYLEGCEFVRADIYKSPLGDSIAQKGIDTLYRTYGEQVRLNLNLQSLKIIAIIGAVAVEALFAHHLEVILQGRKGDKTIFFLLSYGSDGLELLTKKYTNDAEKQSAKALISGRRIKNHLQRSMESTKTIKGTDIKNFLENYCENNSQYNVVTNNCHTFVVEFMDVVWGLQI